MPFLQRAFGTVGLSAQRLAASVLAVASSVLWLREISKLLARTPSHGRTVGRRGVTRPCMPFGRSGSAAQAQRGCTMRRVHQQGFRDAAHKG